MLYYEIIDKSEALDLATSNNSKKCMICHYFFFNHRFESQHFVCNGCHDLTTLNVNISGVITNATVKNVNYLCIIHNIGKSAANNLLDNFFMKIVNIYQTYCPKFMLGRL